ncbi:unnamed protein product [Cylicocyclus nassatus]|uniref:Uncharacterized protein n=1 Tax=Cylicocyclus nassatus TaxID=53992 RepID=A0AA36M508_CYLNA|nr:unnamed protein product [Cylicocyclus nassatus]
MTILLAFKSIEFLNVKAFLIRQNRGDSLLMFPFKHILILLALVGCALALKCYSGATRNKEKAPKTTLECNKIKYCMKETKKSGKDSTHTYGCPFSATDCMKIGCETKNDVTRCCCNKDLCNGSRSLPVFLSFMPLILVKFILY